MTILNKILQEKYKEVEKLKEHPVAPRQTKKRPSLYEALVKADKLQVIAEMKRASPSKGMIREGADPVKQAMQYEVAGAACISVLTDTPFFKGSFEDLQAVAEAVDIPLLCKDFVVDEVQIDQAKASGASVILLIVAALEDDVLKRLHTYATSLGLEVLVEVHDVEELKSALQIDAKIIGVNNRDLKTFTVDLKRTEEVAEAFPFGEDRVLISESGIFEQLDAKRVSKAGAAGVLVGESLMRSDTVEDSLQALQVPIKRRVG